MIKQHAPKGRGGIMFSDKVGSSCSTCEYSKRCSGFINNNIRIISQNIYFKNIRIRIRKLYFDSAHNKTVQHKL
jgi:hypothetical protein